MGLDMYFNRRTYVGNKYRAKGEQVLIHVPDSQKSATFPIKLKPKTERIDTYIEEIMYWRKANAIHKFFIENCAGGVDDCKEIYVAKDKLLMLHDLCKQVIEGSELVEGNVQNGKKMVNGKWEQQWQKGKFIKNPSIAMKLLPTGEGFFFGSTQYDEWYYNDIKETFDMLEKLLEEDPDLTGDYYYQASW